MKTFFRKWPKSWIFGNFRAQDGPQIRPLRPIFRKPLKVLVMSMLSNTDVKPVKSFWKSDQSPEFLLTLVLGYIFCGRSMLKRVRNVTGMVHWRWLVACYSCFMLYYINVCLHFAVMCDNLHRTVISHSLLWNSSRLGVIFSIHDAKSLHRILLVHNKGFCVILDYRSRLVDT